MKRKLLNCKGKTYVKQQCLKKHIIPKYGRKNEPYVTQVILYIKLIFSVYIYGDTW